jgi:ADP-ribosylglycohydrolase.
MLSIAANIAKLKKLPPTKQRCVAAIVGAHVADAASMPLHWIYKQDILDEHLKTIDTPEFSPESKCPFYTLPLGQTSNYNDIMRCMLGYLNSTTDPWDKDGLCAAFSKAFGPGTEHMKMTRQRSEMPVKGPWLQQSMIKLMEDIAAGVSEFKNEDENENDGFIASMPLILMNDVTSQSLWSEMKKVSVLLTVHSPTIQCYHAEALLLQECLNGSADPFKGMKEKLKDLYPELVQRLEDVDNSQDSDAIATVAKNGKACALPGALLGVYLAMKKTSSFVDAVRLNMTTGGDCCNRANVIGACYGALYGIESIPMEWMEKVSGIENTFEMAINIASR